MLQGWLQIAIFLAVLVALTPLLGGYMARVYTRRARVPLAGPRAARAAHLPRAARRPDARAGLEGATRAACSSSRGLFWLALYVILRTQTLHPFNPEGFHSGTWDVTFNTVSSFVTNTNWQYYGGETTMTYFSQMAGLAVQNFVSAAVGICVVVALIRGIAARGGTSLGNFWQDLVRTLLYVLLPISIVGALVLVSQGVIQTFAQLRHRAHARGRHADDRARPGRLAGDHQGARHQRRRLLQRQLGDPVREPDAASRTSSRCC